MSSARALAVLGVLVTAMLGVGAWRVGWSGLWATPDQQGRYLFEHGRFGEAAQAFRDPMWRGTAQMRAGDFKAAETTFAGVDTADGAYNQANALVMLGKYTDAVARYDHALALRPGWEAASANRQIAQLRAERLVAKGEDAGDQREGADQIVYDKDAKQPGSQNAETTGAPAMNDQAVRALWLKRVQTKPADFLRARFSYQLQMQEPAGTGGARE